MVYAQLFTSNRGSLAKIWLAAHWERKLTKNNIFECNLETTTRDIISPKVKIGLRNASHLLLGVVRIYSRKAKYLLADCNDALVRIKMAFRPGQTDLPVNRFEATITAITLIEDFTTFDTQLPHPSEIDVDRYSLNQSRLEEITLREDFGSGFLSFPDIADKSLSQPQALLERNFKSFAGNEDTFGDEDKEYDLLDFLTNPNGNADFLDFILDEPQNQESSALNDHQQEIDADRRDPVQAQTLSLNETTLLADEEVAFALEPVAISPNSEKKIGKRKRKLVVDSSKELSNTFIKEQLLDYSDLVASLDMAPPTVQLMQWKESGGVDKLFSQPCSTIMNPQIKEIFDKKIFQVKYYSVNGEVEGMRHERQEAQRDLSALSSDINSINSSFNTEATHNTELTALDHMNNNCETNTEFEQDENRSEFTHPDLPSEDSMFVHPSHPVQDTQSTTLHTQSMLDSQDIEERRITRRARKLLSFLQQSQSSSDPTVSLGALCEGATRAKVAATFICLLVLKKQQALDLHQTAPYEDIIITPGANFCN